MEQHYNAGVHSSILVKWCKFFCLHYFFKNFKLNCAWLYKFITNGLFEFQEWGVTPLLQRNKALGLKLTCGQRGESVPPIHKILWIQPAAVSSAMWRASSCSLFRFSQLSSASFLHCSSLESLSLLCLDDSQVRIMWRNKQKHAIKSGQVGGLGWEWMKQQPLCKDTVSKAFRKPGERLLGTTWKATRSLYEDVPTVNEACLSSHLLIESHYSTAFIFNTQELE